MPNKTSDEVEELKRNWERDPIWDIEDTEGFEEYSDELRAFRLAKEAEWKERHMQEIREKAAALDCSLSLAQYIYNLELRLSDMTAKIDYLMN